MKAVLAAAAVAGVLMVGALAVPAAQAHTRPVAARSATVERLRVQLQKTREQLAHVVAELTGAKKKLVSARLQVKASQMQVTQLQGTLSQTNATLSQTTAMLTQTQAALASSQARAATLQAKLDAIPTPLAVAEEQVRREVAWAEDRDGSDTPYSEGGLVALSAMNYVSGHVSTGAYGYLLTFGGTLPASTPDSVLGTQAGICGHAALTFASILQHFGYAVRSAQFYFTAPNGLPDSHIADEVFFDGSWHYFDPTFGVYWTDSAGSVLSITDLRAGGGTEHKDDVAFANLIEDPWFDGDDSAFETDPATTLVLDGQPFTS